MKVGNTNPSRDRLAASQFEALCSIMVCRVQVSILKE